MRTASSSWGLNTYNEQGNPLVTETYVEDTLVTYEYTAVTAVK